MYVKCRQNRHSRQVLANNDVDAWGYANIIGSGDCCLPNAKFNVKADILSITQQNYKTAFGNSCHMQHFLQTVFLLSNFFIHRQQFCLINRYEMNNETAFNSTSFPPSSSNRANPRTINTMRTTA